MNKQKIIAFDLDDVICYRPSGYEDLGPFKYDHCQPIQETIDLINELYDDGHKIIVYTARGMSQYNGNVNLIHSNLYCRTITQLNSWSVKYDQLVMGKIHFDVLIDDKVLNSDNIGKDKIVNFIGSS